MNQIDDVVKLIRQFLTNDPQWHHLRESYIAERREATGLNKVQMDEETSYQLDATLVGEFNTSVFVKLMSDS